MKRFYKSQIYKHGHEFFPIIHILSFLFFWLYNKLTPLRICKSFEKYLKYHLHFSILIWAKFFKFRMSLNPMCKKLQKWPTNLRLITIKQLYRFIQYEVENFLKCSLMFNSLKYNFMVLVKL